MNLFKIEKNYYINYQTLYSYNIIYYNIIFRNCQYIVFKITDIFVELQ